MIRRIYENTKRHGGHLENARARYRDRWNIVSCYRRKRVSSRQGFAVKSTLLLDDAINSPSHHYYDIIATISAIIHSRKLPMWTSYVGANRLRVSQHSRSSNSRTLLRSWGISTSNPIPDKSPDRTALRLSAPFSCGSWAKKRSCNFKRSLLETPAKNLSSLHDIISRIYFSFYRVPL